jgi:hypothetical protein
VQREKHARERGEAEVTQPQSEELCPSAGQGEGQDGAGSHGHAQGGDRERGNTLAAGE